MGVERYESVFAVVMMAMLMPLIAAPVSENVQAGQAAVSRFIGEWHGESVCGIKGTACRDETVTYHVSRLAEKAGYVLISAGKLVNGRAVNMGTLEFRYDRDQEALLCEYAQGVWRFKLDGGTMRGTLTTPDNTVVRNVTLHREQ